MPRTPVANRDLRCIAHDVMPANFAGIQVSRRGQPIRRWTTASSMADHGSRMH
ncbi:hypothetical protein C7S13_8402 [Burkholderia cepacia]|nr:hypothetical protein [Burkholderia cepacia]